MKALLKRVFGEAQIEAPAGALDMFELYTALLLEWNKKTNLTAITAPEDIAVKHYADSLSLLPHLGADAASLIDIGSGAGFPGVPIKILRPDIRLTLLDSLNKRALFLQELARRLGLADVQIIHARAEDAADGLWEAFDIAATRAVASLAMTSAYALPFVKPGGAYLAMKGGNPCAEIEAAREHIAKMGGEILSTKEASLPSGIKHSIVTIGKTRPTPPGCPKKLLKALKRQSANSKAQAAETAP
jgi:16S rRNA (guanine527-N7)-methyltransferase